MSSRYASSSSNPYNYQPASPPWSQGGSPPHRRYEGPPHAPVMPYATLPPLQAYTAHTPASSHHGLITPPPTPSGKVHRLLSAHPTVVRYDFSEDPSTARLSSAMWPEVFPAFEPACSPRLSTLYIQCQLSGQVVVINKQPHSNGITCQDVFVQLHRYFAQSLSESEWGQVTDQRQRRKMKAAFSSRSTGSRGMMRLDYLQGQNVFERLVFHHEDRSGMTFILQTTSTP